MSRVTNLKKTLKNTVKKITVGYHRRFMSYGRDDLIIILSKLGLSESDNVFVHSSYDQFLGFQGKPYDVVESIRQVIGATGTILMPSMPFKDSALRYITSGKKFDLCKTPSAMGLLTELFRRDPDTRRSSHPTHPILANGPLADFFISGHEKATTPCGKHSPFDKLTERGGKFLLLGTGIEVLTFFHYLEERFEENMPRSPFTEDHHTVVFTGDNGDERVINTRLYDQAVSRSRSLSPLQHQLRINGHWKHLKLGTLKVALIRADDIVKAYQQLIAQNVFCYDS